MKKGDNLNCRYRTRAGRLLSVFCLLFLFAGVETLFASDARDQVFAERAHAAFDQAQIQFQSHTNDPVAAWEFGRACYDWADWATNKAQRAAIARDGIAACRHSLALADSAAGHYYLAFNFGQLAHCEMLGGLKLVHEMEREFKTTAGLDAHFDFAGPERCLGLLYRDAPGWPLSIGSRHKAREWLDQAEQLAPDYPENHLNLAEAFLRWHDRAGAERELKALDALWPVARTHLTGPAWEPSWADWSARREAVRKRLDETSPPAGSPKN